MATVTRRDHLNVRVPLNRRHGEHRVGNKWIVLCCDDESRNRDGIEYMARTSPVVVIGAVSIASIVSGVTIVEFADRGDPIKLRKIPFPRQ